MPVKIDWYYHRNGCRTCAKAQEALTEATAEIAEQVDARRDRISPDEALGLARKARHLWVAKGKKVVHVDMRKDQPSDDELRKLLIGPSGDLRAPTVRRGDRLFVGFEPEQFQTAMLGRVEG